MSALGEQPIGYVSLSTVRSYGIGPIGSCAIGQFPIGAASFVSSVPPVPLVRLITAPPAARRTRFAAASDRTSDVT